VYAGGIPGKKRDRDIHHGRVEAGLTLTLDIAVGRMVGQIAGAKKVRNSAKCPVRPK
jgi:hypothetical protein